jgi:predicted transcriptional regulator
MTDSLWQPTFFEPAVTPVKRKRGRKAETSVDGLLGAVHKLPKQQRTVLEVLRSHGPMTRHEIAAVCQLPLSSVCGRVAELMKAGSVRIQKIETQFVRRDGRHVIEATFQVRRVG